MAKGCCHVLVLSVPNQPPSLVRDLHGTTDAPPKAQGQHASPADAPSKAQAQTQQCEPRRGPAPRADTLASADSRGCPGL